MGARRGADLVGLVWFAAGERDRGSQREGGGLAFFGRYLFMQHPIPLLLLLLLLLLPPPPLDPQQQETERRENLPLTASSVTSSISLTDVW